ncbi:MAG TPA: chemotaxis protein CheA [Stellaceae bacterium]|jgi:two-component system chemotaxis sensor kinase CheA
MDELLRDFIAETTEHLTVLDRDLVAIEQSPEDRGLIGDAFRTVHSIKGTCGFLGLKRLETLLHAAETLLGKIRDGVLPAGPAIGMLLGACDRAKTIVTALASEGHEPDGADGDIVARLELSARAGTAMPGAEAPRAPEPATGGPAASEPATPPLGAAGSIRVNLDTIDRLMAEVSELVLTRNQLMQMLRDRTDGEAMLALQRLSHVTSDLQESVMQTRMQPIGQAWAKLPRMMRDLGRELGKKIELKLEGSETELDRQVLELIKDPFTHLIRNAADHGIETPAERRRAGKTEAGTVTLAARQEGSAIVITLADDGHGIDARQIRASLRRGDFATEAELRAMSEQQLQQFVFHPGFTTAAQVTSVSGRGVGLDVVRSNVEKLGGTVELASTPGRGTRFTIKIPLTLAIVPALLLDCVGQRFAIPQTAVAELIRAGADHPIEWIHDAPVLRLRGNLLPLVALRDVLGFGTPAGERETLIAVLGYGMQRFGVMIDDVDDAEEIVVKSLSPLLRGIKLFAGSTILGDGSVVLILDPGALAAAVGTVESVEPPRAAPPLRHNAVPRSGGWLLFRAGADTPKALPLAAILRIEEVAPRQIEWIESQPVMLYRGATLPLHSFGILDHAPGKQCVVVVEQSGKTGGFLVDEIIDTVDETPVLDRTLARPGVLGVAMMGGRMTEILDIADGAAAGKGDAKSSRSAA